MSKVILNNESLKKLNEYYNALSYVDRLVLRDKLMLALMIDKNRFYALLNGRVLMRDLYAAIINQVIGKELLTIATTTKKQ